MSSNQGSENNGKVLGIDSTGNVIPVVNESQPSTNGFSGKIVSILGDSISTFAGYTPVADGHNLTHRNRYPQADLFTEVEYCWWYKLINSLGAKLGINDSWAGSRVHNSSDTNSGDQGPDACMASMTRITNLGSNGTPDVILFYGGTNDCGGSITLGTFDSTANHHTVDLASYKWDTFADAYKCAIMRLQHFYPDAKIIVMLPTYCTSYYTMGRLDQYNEIIKEICDYFGIPVIDLRQCGINWQNKSYTLGDGIHPTASGADLIFRFMKQNLLSMYSIEAGERIIYTLAHNYTDVSSDKFWYKGTIGGQSYTETLDSTEGVTVTVTMSGLDITSTVYDSTTGIINIANVTGNVEITATKSGGSEITWYTNASYDGTNSVNVAGYGWAPKYSDTLVGKPVNIVGFKSNNASGSFELGKTTLRSSSESDIQDVQTVAWDSSNKDSNNIVTIELPNTITLSSDEVFVVYPLTQPDVGAFLFAQSEGDGFYTDVPVSRRGSTPWTSNNLNLQVNFGYKTQN